MHVSIYATPEDREDSHIRSTLRTSSSARAAPPPNAGVLRLIGLKLQLGAVIVPGETPMAVTTMKPFR
jgi:hypothetical protein